jgi:nitroimidazol reductase NimA-like FMN-containing flavoprotein (pyridoxamine 5'-phosphate oxidase superfamily)
MRRRHLKIFEPFRLTPQMRQCLSQKNRLTTNSQSFAYEARKPKGNLNPRQAPYKGAALARLSYFGPLSALKTALKLQKTVDFSVLLTTPSLKHTRGLFFSLGSVKTRMAIITGVWSETQLEDFLQDSRLPIRIATQREDGSLWIVALWYRYQNGSFECATGATSQLVRFLDRDSKVAFDISTNHPPYRGVRGNGTTTISSDKPKTTLRALIEQYLGDTQSDLAKWLLSDERDEVRIQIHPNQIYSWDYANRMQDIETPTS